MTTTFQQTIPREKVVAYVKALKALADAIRETGPRGVSSGTLYGVMSHFMSLDAYERTIGLLVSSGLVRKYESGILTWIGPVHRRD